MFSRKHNTVSRRSTKAIARAARTACVFEQVEQRTHMSVSLNNGLLTVAGTAGNDTIVVEPFGTTQVRVTDNGKVTFFNKASISSVIATLGNGNDSYDGRWMSQSQTISGGAGNDTIRGGQGADQMFGQDGDDMLRGHEGADLFSGGAGYDWADYGGYQTNLNISIDGVANDGMCSTPLGAAYEGDNVMTDMEGVIGGDYTDFITGSDADNQLRGMNGNDYIYGGGGNDGLSGGYGNDTVIGGDGNDWLWGGLGADLMIGGNGTDDMRYDEAERTGGVNATLAVPGSYNTSSGNGANGENDRIRGDIENLVGTRFADYLAGNSAANGISGMDGNDFISGGMGNDWLNGNAGNDIIYGNAGNDLMWGEAGSDSFSGGDGWDDVRYDDAFHNSAGRGVVARLTMSYDNKGGNGISGENDFIYDDNEALIGTNYGDVLTGNDYNNYIAGLDGDDFISGHRGDDTIDAGKGADWIWGDEGNDTLFGKDGGFSDHLDGGVGYDTIERDRSFLVISLGGAARFRTDTYSNGEVIR
jgi:Ca2+-binding RTX toxin-like protein